MKLKEAIIIKSIDLFNQYGFDKVSVRAICEELDISPGNFTYHFPRKEALLETIFDRVMSGIEEKFQPRPLSFRTMDKMFDMIISFQKDYFFIFKDIFGLIQEYPFMESIIDEVVVVRIRDINDQVRRWQEEGLIDVRDELQDQSYMIGKSLWLLFSSWASQKEVLKNSQESLRDYEIKHMFWSVFYPYFTDQGWKHFQELKAEHKILK